MLTSIAKFIGAKKGRSRQGGQIIVIGALGFVGLVAVAGLAVDGGRAYVNRRSLQASADSGADAAMRMILQDYRDFSAGKATQTFSDCDIFTVVSNVTRAANSSTASSGIDSYVAKYTNASGNAPASGAGPGNPTAFPRCTSGGVSSASSLHLCTDGGQTTDPNADCVAGLVSVPQYNQQTYLLNVVGIQNSTQTATSNSVFRLAHINLGTSAPWVVWHWDCSTLAELHGETTPPPNASHDGSIQTIHVTNGWPGTAGCGGAAAGNTASSASFKGFIGDSNCGKATYTPAPVYNICDGTGGYPTGSYNASGVNGNIANALTAVQNALLLPVACPSYTSTGKCNGAPPTALILPVISTISGQGNSYDFTVVKYVAAVVLDTSTVQVVFTCVDFPGNPSTYNHCNVPTNEQTVFSAFLS